MAQAEAPAGASAASGAIRYAATQDVALVDPETKRSLRLRIRLPASGQAAPLILYSPGLGSGLGNGAAWCEAWRQAGFVVVTLAHPLSDEGIWNTSRRSFRANLSAALAFGQYGLRAKDCRFAIRMCCDELGIGDRIDPRRIGVAGHSYGALTVQLLARQAGGGGAEPGDRPITAAIAFSPGAQSRASARQMAQANMPFFCVTGDRDNHVVFRLGSDAKRLGVPLPNRIAVFEGLPRGSKQLLVLAGADHMSFAGEPVDPQRFSRDIAAPSRSDPEVWRKAATATTLFWHHYFRYGPGTDRLDYGSGVKAGLNSADRFEMS